MHVRRMVLAAMILTAGVARLDSAEAPSWVEPMRKVHEGFKGERGTLACFGDSITVTMAFWAPLEGAPKGMSKEMAEAHARVKGYLKPECWRAWKGPAHGSNGGMTIRWAHDNIDGWLTRLNPETALIMFGTNDIGGVPEAEYEAKTRAVVEKCLKNGTVVILSTIPPRSGRLGQSEKLAAIVRRIAREKQVPLIDYHAEVLKRRPDDWDGSLPQFRGKVKDVYQVPTLVSGDGVHPSNPREYQDYSEASLRHNGYLLRNYLALLAYDEVVRRVLRPGAKPVP